MPLLETIALTVAATGLAALSVGTIVAVVRERAARPRPVPVIVDPGHRDGGAAACLAMVLASHGRPVALDAMRGAIASPDGGTTALRMLEVAHAHGLRGKGLQLGSHHDLVHIPLPAILHLRESAFVVLAELRGNRAVVHDARTGRRTWRAARLWRHISGIALMLEPAPPS